MGEVVRLYGVIIADPPWSYERSAVEGAAAREYATLDDAAIAALPVAELAADDCLLLLWATWPKLTVAVDTVAAWGFEYVTGLPWVKIIGVPQTTLWGELQFRTQYGVGYWFRGCSEPLLVARRGNVSPPINGFVGLLSENYGHSRKPENIYHIAEQLPGPYLELFARRPREGWDVWGNEVSCSVQMEV